MGANDTGVFGKLPITLWVSHTHNTVPPGRLARQGGLTHTHTCSPWLLCLAWENEDVHLPERISECLNHYYGNMWLVVGR